MLTFSLIGVFFLLILIPSLVNKYLNISPALRLETLDTFYALAISIPIVSTTAGLRGVLEAYQKFDIINVIRVFLGVFTFLGPLICLIFSKSLVWIVIFLIFVRIVIWIQFLFFCFKVNNNISHKIKFDISLIKPILKIGGWITVANILAPLILYSDRFIIGVLVSATAVAYYATPYEIVTKILLVPGALVTVLFPVFSASYITNPDFSRKIFLRGVKFIFLFMYPIIFIIVMFSYEGISLWLGKDFAGNSSFILQLLAIGVLFNGVAYIPFNFLQGIGKPHLPALINLLELPIYILTMWLFVQKWGINGAAAIWLIRILFDTAALFFVSNRIISKLFASRIKIVSISIMLLILFVPFLLNNIKVKMFFSIGILALYFLISWKYFLQSEEKFIILSKIKIAIHNSKFIKNG